MKHVAYSAVKHTACQQMKVGSSALRVDDGHMMIVQVLTMMMNILFVIYVRRPIIMVIEIIITSSLGYLSNVI